MLDLWRKKRSHVRWTSCADIQETTQYMTKAELPESVVEHPDVTSKGVERVRMVPLIGVSGAVRRA